MAVADDRGCVCVALEKKGAHEHALLGDIYTWTLDPGRLRVEERDMPSCPVQAAAAADASSDADGAGRGGQLEPIEPLAGSSIIKRIAA
jgi:hypothetical protein